MVENTVSVEEIKAHSSEQDCWIVVDDVVWDITEFVPKHPGGKDSMLTATTRIAKLTLSVIYRHAGLDASSAYSAVHSPSLIAKTLGSSKRKGKIDSKTSSALLKPPPTEDAQPKLSVGAKPPLTSLINSYDFEAVAEKTLTKKAWAFYSSAATNLVTRDANRTLFDRIWFRPRLLRNIRDIDTRTRILGQNVNLPFFVSPAAMAKLAHPEGEIALAKGCEKFGIAQCVRSPDDAQFK